MTTVIKIPVKTEDVLDENPIKVSFNGRLVWEGVVMKNLNVTPGRVLVTVQQNNMLHWITDYIEHYKSQFDVSHVILYDNESDQYSCEDLSNLDSCVKVIEWPFPYGIYRADMEAVGVMSYCSQIPDWSSQSCEA